MNINTPARLSFSESIIFDGSLTPPKKNKLIGEHSLDPWSVGMPSSRHPREAHAPSSSGFDYGGLLTKAIPMNVEDQTKLRLAVDAWKARQQQTGPGDIPGTRSLIELLLRTLPEYSRPANSEPEKALQAILVSSEGQALAALLQDSIDVVPTASSLQDVLLSALLLDAGYGSEQQRNNLAGYSLRQQGNWGYSAAEIAKRFEDHLATRFGVASAKTIAFLLLSVSAPEFLVKKLPASLVYGSHQWATFSAAVARIDASQPGSAASMNYSAIMARDEQAPVSVTEKLQRQYAQMQAVTDWGIANGIILENSDDDYTFESIGRAVDAMQTLHTTLADSVTALNTPVPTRRELALEELRRVYGAENERFFTQKLLGDIVPGSPGRKSYSLLDIYMSGELGKHFWISSDPEFNTVKVNLGFSALKNIKSQFVEKFDEYTKGLKEAFTAQFKYQLSSLPAEDRRLIEYGKVTTFSLVHPNRNQGPVSSSHKIHPYVDSGAVLIRADLDGKVCHYLYSPAQGRIIKDADPSRPGLQLPGSRLYFSMSLPDSPAGKEPAVTILWQPLGTPWPKKDPIDFAAFSIYPSKSLQAGTPGPHSTKPLETFTSSKSNELANAVSAYFTRGLEEVKVAANGMTEIEIERRTAEVVNEFFLGFIPFYSAVKSFIDGKPTEGFFYAVLDVFGFLTPALKGGIQGAKAVVKSGMGSALGFLKGFGKTSAQMINPLAGVYDVGRGVFNLSKAGFKKLRPLSGHYGSFEPPLLRSTDSIAEGIYRPWGANADGARVTAVKQNDLWYAFDVSTQTPYGAPLKGFVPRSYSPFMTQIIQTASSTAIDVGVFSAISFAENALKTHYARLPVQATRFDPGEVAVPELPSVPGIFDPSLLSRLDASSRSMTELDKLILALVSGHEEPICIKCAEPLEYLDKLETALEKLEDHTVLIADAYQVYCKPYNPRAHGDWSNSSLMERVEAIEKRVDEVRKALVRVQALLGVSA
ncbi:hypothetical protein [Pseudomonas sp. B22129]|uniref:hypothetical protein n=1 Tax=Pseudomonas sp. B22129 TaxID=3235111 RepID=UPI00378463B5